MLSLIQLLIFLMSIGACAYFRLSAVYWTVIVATVLLLYAVYSSISLIFIIVCWILFLVCVIYTWVPSLRKLYFSKPLMAYFRRNLPSMSVTEREALEAGDTWIEASLFQGRPDWKTIFALEKPTLSEEEQDFLANEVEVLCSMINDWQIVHDKCTIPDEIWRYIKEKGFLGMVIPKEHGGKGFSALAHSSIVVKVASRSASVVVNIMVPNSLGPAELILQYGTGQQKEFYLPRLARGEEIPCFALTSNEAGSDAGALIDSGMVCRQMFEGKEVTGLKLNWDKRYITLAPIATLIGLAVKVWDPEHLLSEETYRGITVCLVSSNLPGVESGKRHYPMGLAFTNGPTRGKDVFIPLDYIVGGADYLGKGWYMLVECLSIGRAISLPAMSTACGKLCYRTTGAYARIRRQFNTYLAQFEGVEEYLARIAVNTYTIEAMRLMTTQAVDAEIKPAIVSAIAKYHMTELGRQVMNDAMDIHGGKGIQAGPNNYLAAGYMSQPIGITVEGANILTRNLMIFGQGAMRCHPYLFAEMQAAGDPDTKAGLVKFDRLLFKHIGYTTTNFARCSFMGLTRAVFVRPGPYGKLKPYLRQLTRMSAALAFVSDKSLMYLGGDLKRKERLSARLGDVLSQLYVSSALMKYTYDHDLSEEDLLYLKYGILVSLHKIQVAFDEFFRNFPQPWIGRIWRFVVFPWGTSYRLPRDRLAHKIAKTMLTPSRFRERLTQHCYLGDDKTNAVAALEDAFLKAIESQPILDKINQAVSKGLIDKNIAIYEKIDAALAQQLITADDKEILVAAEDAIFSANSVDEFQPEDLIRGK